MAKTSSFTPSLRAAEPIQAATGRATLRLPQTIVMAEAKKSVKDLPASALKGKKVHMNCAVFQNSPYSTHRPQH